MQSEKLLKKKYIFAFIYYIMNIALNIALNYNKYCSQPFDELLIEHFTKHVGFFNFYLCIYIFCKKLLNVVGVKIPHKFLYLHQYVA